MSSRVASRHAFGCVMCQSSWPAAQHTFHTLGCASIPVGKTFSHAPNDLRRGLPSNTHAVFTYRPAAWLPRAVTF
eukprot:360946-Chlamydomonas_euryale.AAC.18